MKLSLKAARINKNLTRKQVAAAVGVCDFMIGAYERGDATPSLKTALALANVYGVPVEDLIFKKRNPLKNG